MIDAGDTFVTPANDLREHLAKWIAARQDNIHAAYLKLRAHGRLLFVVVQRDVRRNAALADAITDLDIEIASDDRFANLRVDVQTLPRSSTEAISAFLPSGNDVVEYVHKDSGSRSSDPWQSPNQQA